ncbi:leucine-rich repeat protein [Carboxylicivirga sp. RSCT41]|uniref:leucine-rich repeat domain-containing protein n=1 Tax=Carboxylicivirga agarovorans TaxID=3417570 RepID=UPI003D3289F1
MNKLITILLCLTAIGSGTLKAQYTLSINDVEFDTSTGTITNYINHRQKNIVIPGSFKGHKVRAIGKYAFSRSDLESVVIPASVTDIGEMAFSINSLTAIELPKGLKSIEALAFASNYIRAVNIPRSVRSIKTSAFANNRLTTVNIPRKVKSIGAYAFAYNLLTSISLPLSVSSIGRHAFLDNQLSAIPLPNTRKTWRNCDNEVVREIAVFTKEYYVEGVAKPR